MKPFLQLDDFLLPPPAAAFLSVTIALALLGLGYAVAVRLRGREVVRAIDVAGGMVLATGLVCAVVHYLALAGLASLSLLRLIAFAVIAGGAWNLRHWFSHFWVSARTTIERLWRTATPLERWALVCVVAVIGGFGLAALGPATEIDSLDYHLGVPLEWLRNGGAIARTDWLTAPFIGVGDSVNLLGLASGSDSLGSIMQVSGLLIALTALASCATDNRNRILAAGIASGCLAWMTLLPSQKPFALPAAATTVAAVLLSRRAVRSESGAMTMAFGCIAFAAGCKFSFLFSGTVLLAGGLWIAWREGRTRAAVLAASVLFIILALPTYAGNMWLYGDPLWPFLQRFVRGADPVALDFAWYIRNFGSSIRSLRHYLLLPVEIVVPWSPGRLGNALGIGCFTGLLALRGRNANRALVLASAAVAILVLMFGQLTPRFFLEPYLWCGAAVVMTPWSAMKRFFSFCLTLQLTGMAIVALYAAFVLFPGAFGRDWRHRVMDERASGSAVCRWMDRTLPRDAIIASSIRSHALYPRPFIASDLALFLNRTNLEPSVKRSRLLAALRERHVNVLVLQLPLESGPYAAIAADIGAPLGPPVEFREAARNPFGRGSRFTMQAFAMPAAADHRE